MRWARNVTRLGENNIEVGLESQKRPKHMGQYNIKINLGAR
jgi:hypothetical protein